MNHKMKPLGLAIMAVLAMTAMMASTAQAQFTSNSEFTNVFGTQSETIKFTAGTGIGGITCSILIATGSQWGKSAPTLDLDLAIEGCKDSLGRTTDVMKNTLELDLLSGSEKGKATVTGELKLTATGAAHCTIATSNDQTVNGITYTNNGDGSVTVTTHTNNMTSTIAGGFFGCGTSATHSSTGTLSGSMKLVGNSGAATISVD